ncbi:hypothetical protein Esti_000852 [Eimeria stiedai]
MIVRRGRIRHGAAADSGFVRLFFHLSVFAVCFSYSKARLPAFFFNSSPLFSEGGALHRDSAAMRHLSCGAAAAFVGASLLAAPLLALAVVSPADVSPSGAEEASLLAAELAQVEGAAEAEAEASAADLRETEEREQTPEEAAETQGTDLMEAPSSSSFRGSPRRLMAVAGAGLVLLAGGALANEHFDSIKAGVQSLIHGIKNKPFSWTFFSWRLPRVNEDEFPEFRIVAEGLEGVSPSAAAAAAEGGPAGGGGAWSSTSAQALPRKRTFVHIVEKPTEALADFLGLGPHERQHGFAIKGRSYRAEFGREQSAWEVFAMQRHIPKHPLLFSMIKALRSPNTGNIYLILPRACCDLSQYYRGAPRALDVQTAAAEMAYSLHLLHARGFLHRDIKPPNYFVSQEGHVQLADFEMLWPVSLPCPQEEATQTRGFTAPELRRFGAYVPFTIKSDVYALGMSYARLLMRVRRYQRVPNQGLFTKLILEMVSNSIPDRLDLDGVLKHKYFEGIDWDLIGRGEAPPPCPLAKQVLHRLADAKKRMQPQQGRERDREGKRPKRGGEDRAGSSLVEEGNGQPQQVETAEHQQQQEQRQQEQQQQEHESEVKALEGAGLQALQNVLQETDESGTPVKSDPHEFKQQQQQEQE